MDYESEDRGSSINFYGSTKRWAGSKQSTYGATNFHGNLEREYNVNRSLCYPSYAPHPYFPTYRSYGMNGYNAESYAHFDPRIMNDDPTEYYPIQNKASVFHLESQQGSSHRCSRQNPYDAAPLNTATVNRNCNRINCHCNKLPQAYKRKLKQEHKRYQKRTSKVKTEVNGSIKQGEVSEAVYEPSFVEMLVKTETVNEGTEENTKLQGDPVEKPFVENYFVIGNDYLCQNEGAEINDNLSADNVAPNDIEENLMVTGEETSQDNCKDSQCLSNQDTSSLVVNNESLIKNIATLNCDASAVNNLSELMDNFSSKIQDNALDKSNTFEMNNLKQNNISDAQLLPLNYDNPENSLAFMHENNVLQSLVDSTIQSGSSIFLVLNHEMSTTDLKLTKEVLLEVKDSSVGDLPKSTDCQTQTDSVDIKTRDTSFVSNIFDFVSEEIISSKEGHNMRDETLHVDCNEGRVLSKSTDMQDGTSFLLNCKTHEAENGEGKLKSEDNVGMSKVQSYSTFYDNDCILSQNMKDSNGVGISEPKKPLISEAKIRGTSEACDSSTKETDFENPLSDDDVFLNSLINTCYVYYVKHRKLENLKAENDKMWYLFKYICLQMGSNMLQTLNNICGKLAIFDSDKVLKNYKPIHNFYSQIKMSKSKKTKVSKKK